MSKQIRSSKLVGDKKNHHRFLVDAKNIGSDLFVTDDPGIINQIKNVFRLGLGSQISVFDGLGNEYEIEISSIDKKSIKGNITKREIKIKGKLKINLFCSPLKGDHFEIILEKCTELGVDSFQPVIFDRSIIRELKPNRLERYKKIIKEASEQSGRQDLPVVFEPIGFMEVIKKTMDGFNLVSIIGASKNILDIRTKNKEINIFVGPEGDFSKPEIDLMKKEGFLFFNQGDNVLRSETAAIVSCGIITQFML